MSAIMELWNENILGKMLVLMLSFMLVILIAFPFMLIHNENQWEEFIRLNDCKLTEKVPANCATGTSINTNGSIGIVTIVSPEKLGYLCKDGTIYWK